MSSPSRVILAGKVIMVGSIVFFLGAFGVAKFTPAEIEAIEPLVVSSPVFSWLASALGMTATSYAIGVVEIATALLILARPLDARLSMLGGLVAAATFVVTLSFLFTTPGLDEGMIGFIMKDITLLGVALWWAGDCWASLAARRDSRAAIPATAA